MAELFLPFVVVLAVVFVGIVFVFVGIVFVFVVVVVG